ncbi:MAG: hypothetical protein H3C62_05890, partial [Gemmatimonadaceae bacterium]|nr:hypothetical protein [Gemmatimonadaceae bacterium]
FVRLTVLDSADAHCNLGTGAESFFVRQAVAQLEQRNRERFRAIRRAELGLAPLSEAMATQPWIKCVRTFSDPAARHSGGIYRACGWLPIGATRAEHLWVGLRSELPLSGRQRSKLLNPDDAGHLSNGVRAAWEGADCLLEGRDATGAVVATCDLSRLRDLPQFDVVAAKRRLREMLRDTPSGHRWSVRYLAGGFRIEERPPKSRFALFLGTAPVARAIARRCRYLQPALLAADAAWFAPARRWGRGVGFNWPRRPTDLDLLSWARRETS